MIAAAVLAVTIIVTPTPEPAPLPVCEAGQEAQPFEDGYVCGPADPAIPELLDGLEVEQGGPAPYPMPTPTPTFTSGPAPVPHLGEEPPAEPTPKPTRTGDLQLPLPAPYVDEPQQLAETGPADLAPLTAAGGLLVLLGTLLTRIGRRSA